MRNIELFDMPFLTNTRNKFNRELFPDKKGHWIYLDKNKQLTNNLSLAKYQKWVKTK